MEKPSPRQGEALVKVAYGGICGTDMMIYAGKHPRAKAPLVMCHEFSGEIVEMAADPADPHLGSIPPAFAVGDRVIIEPTLSCGRCAACVRGQTHVCKQLRLIGIDSHGGFAEYVTVPLHRLHPVPQKLSADLAALAEPVAVGVHTIRRSALQIGDTAVVLGCGPIGLIVALLAREAGAAQVIVSDISPFRLRKAESFGFTALDAKKANVIEEVLARTDGIGADVVFEVAGTEETATQMVALAKIQGQITVVSMFKKPPAIDLAAMHFQEKSLTTTRCYTRADFQHAIRLLAGGDIDFSALISHRMPLEEIGKGFELMQNTETSLKILIQP